MGQSRFSWGVIVLCGLLGIVLPSCDRSPAQVPDADMIQRTNVALSSRHLPKLPDGVTMARCWTGGMFAKYMNVKFTASPDQALDFLRRAGAGCYSEFQVEGKNCRIVANHALAATPQGVDTVGLSLLAKGTGMLSRPWFKSVYEIRHGWHYGLQDGIAGYDVYYDVDNQQLYVYWHYS